MKTLHCFFVAFAFAAVACGNPSQKTNEANTSDELMGQKPTKPLIVGMAGYSTCAQSKEYHDGQWGPLGSPMFRRVEGLAKTVTDKFGVEPTILASCFTSESKIIASSSLDDWSVTQPQDEEYLDRIYEQLPLYTDVFVVGHSYGGWLAMKMAESYEGDPSLIKTLHTIDPISKKLCFFDSVPECLSAPRDILSDARAHISLYTGVWVNPWQDATFFLHSSAISEADFNPKYNLDHWAIDNNEDVWKDINQRVSL
jgi:pimeloyl-ACP methyl ester carboxylesterase